MNGENPIAPRRPLGIPLLSANQLIPRTARAFASDLARCTVAVAWFQGQGKVDTRRHSRTASGGSVAISFPPHFLLSRSASLYASLRIPHTLTRRATPPRLLTRLRLLRQPFTDKRYPVTPRNRSSTADTPTLSLYPLLRLRGTAIITADFSWSL